VRRLPPGSASGSHRRSSPVVPPRLALQWSAVPRRGVPIPLRSACVVFHDLGGFRLLGPGGVFHPLTPLGFCSRLPDAGFRSMGPKTQLPGARPCAAYQWCVSHDTRGASARSEDFRPTPRQTAAETATRAARSPLPLPKEVVRLPAPSHAPEPSPCPDHRSDHSSGLPVPVPPRPKSGSPGPPRRRTVAAFRPIPVWGLPLLLVPAASWFPSPLPASPGSESVRATSRRRPSPRTRLRYRPNRLSTTRPLATCQLDSDFSLPLPREWSRVTGVAGDEDSKSICERASTFERHNRTASEDRQMVFAKNIV